MMPDATLINPLESHMAEKLSITPLGKCCRCGGEAFLRCNCRVLLCNQCRADHMAAAGVAQGGSLPAAALGKLESQLWKIPACAGCGQKLNPPREIWWRVSNDSERTFCRLCAAQVAGQKPLPAPRPAEDTIIRGGCGRGDVTVGDLRDEANFSDVLVWLGIAAAVVGVIMLLLAFT